jgi:hypothetical protein
MLRAFSYMIAIISPTYAQLFLYYIYLAYMFRPIRSSSGHLRYTKGSEMCLKCVQYIKLLKHLYFNSLFTIYKAVKTFIF